MNGNISKCQRSSSHEQCINDTVTSLGILLYPADVQSGEGMNISLPGTGLHIYRGGGII